MFVRDLKHKNGKTYVQVVSKSTGKYKVLKGFGSSQTASELEILHNKANRWINETSGSIELDFDNEKSIYNNLLENHKIRESKNKRKNTCPKTKEWRK